MKFTGIVAIDRNCGMGYKNKLPWYIPEDLKLFKARTLNHPILMGRKTYESIGKPLPNRQNIVLTHNWDYRQDGVIVIHDLVELKKIRLIDEEVFVIGGAEIFNLLKDKIERFWISEVKVEAETDVKFPINLSESYYSREVMGKYQDFNLVLYERIKKS